MQVRAVDADEGLNTILVYSIFDINGQPTTAVTINSTSGHVTADVTFDRESRDLYEFVVTCSDQGLPVSRSSSVLVRLEISDEDDDRPTFVYGVYTFGTYENQPSGTEVGTVAAIDRDLAPYNEIEYHLQDNGNGAFEIGCHTGRITVTRPLDRETEFEYHLAVVASQRGAEDDPTGSSIARVKVIVADRNDNQPRFVFPAVANDSILVATCHARLGVPVGRIIAQDRDIGANAALRYRLLSDLPVEYQAFDVNPLSGVVSARQALTESEYPLHVQVRDAGSPPLVADTWLNVHVNCSELAAAQGPPSDVMSRSQLGGMLVMIVMATIASALFVICILAATVVLRHCITASGNTLRTDSKPEPDHVTSAGSPTSSPDRDGVRLKIARDVTTSRDYRSNWYPPRYNSLEATLPQRCITNVSTTTPQCSSVGRVRPMTGGQSSHVTLSGRNQPVPITTSFNDDVRHCLLYGINIVPAKRHPVRIDLYFYFFTNVCVSVELLSHTSSHVYPHGKGNQGRRHEFATGGGQKKGSGGGKFPSGVQGQSPGEGNFRLRRGDMHPCPL